ncbi:VC0807 family protein [Amycolatopsis sp. NPDC049252]|uniref:VC0807 family protein n=1 Tax=Amycolatopsis sp. NPDC049252 TaxID=3363933 RepID=UPI003713DE9B
MTTTAPKTSAAGAIVTNLVVDLVAPIALYYGLRAAGVDQLLALLAGGAAPLVHVIWQVARTRKVGGLALFTLTILVLSVAASFLTGSERFLLAKDGWLTAVAGLWLLATLRTNRPFIYEAARPIADAKAKAPEDTWTHRFATSESFRHGMRVVTAAWGIALVLDAVVRGVMAYTLPVDLVPGLGGAQYAVLFVGLQIFGQVYGQRTGLIGDKKKSGPAGAVAA